MAQARSRPIVPTEHVDEREHRRLLAVRTNAAFPKDGTEGMTAPLSLAAYATADLPDPALWTNAVVYVTDTQSLAYSNGVAWLQLAPETGPEDLPSYTVAGVPSAASNPASLIFVTDQTGGSTVAFSDGTKWRDVRDHAVITAGNIGYANVMDFGAAGDGTTDDTTAFTNAIASLGTTGGTVFVDPQKKFYIGNNLTVTNGVMLRGGLDIVGSPTTLSNAGLGAIWNYGSCLKLLSTKTITLQGGAGLNGLLLLRSTMTGEENNAASYAGTAVTIGGDDTIVQNSMILGFNQAYTSSNYHRMRIHRVNLDCVNGIHIDNCFDVPYLREVHAWPFGTIAASAPVTSWDANHFGFRNGVAFNFTNVCDIGKISDCFSFGYLIGYSVAGPAAFTLTGCAADGISRVGAPSIIPNTIGFYISGTADMTTLTNCEVAAQNNAYYIDLNTSPQEVILNGCRCWAIEGSGVANVKGSCTVIGCSLRGVGAAGYGILNLDATGSIIAVGNRLTSGWTANTFGALAVNLGNV